MKMRRLSKPAHFSKLHQIEQYGIHDSAIPEIFDFN
jgi:hypothetical protein